VNVTVQRISDDSLIGSSHRSFIAAPTKPVLVFNVGNVAVVSDCDFFAAMTQRGDVRSLHRRFGRRLTRPILVAIR